MNDHSATADAALYPLTADRILTNDLPQAEVEASLRAVRDAFGQEWLDQRKPNHPVRELWRLNDFVSTQELFLLGDSISRLEEINARWLRDTVRDAKSTEIKRRGALFEIVALGALARGGHRILPRAHGGEHYDLDVELDDGRTGRISLKHFGITYKAQVFLDKARLAVRNANKEAGARDRRWLGVYAHAERYPGSADWIALDILLKQFVANSSPRPASKGIWQLVPLPAPVGAESLAFSWNSYDIQIVSPHDEIEEKSYQDKIEKACDDLNRASASFGKNVEPIVLVRLDENAFLELYTAWAKEYVRRPTTRIAGIVFLQSTIAIDAALDTTAIYYTFTEALRPDVSPMLLRMTVMTGLSKRTPPRILLADGSALVNHHVYTEGELYEAQRVDLTQDTPYTGSMHQFPNRIRNAVMRFVENGESHEMMLGFRQRTPTRLTLFS